MNIFVTSNSPIQSAKYLDDKRVIKMIAESTQLLCTALTCWGVSDTPVRPTHKNHPAAVWVRQSRENYVWLLRHCAALMHEKRRRYPENKPHVYEQHLKYLRNHASVLPKAGRTQFANCASNKEQQVSFANEKDVCLAYRKYLAVRWQNDKRTPTWYRKQRSDYGKSVA